MSAPWDLLILGGGPGGYVAALRGAQLGAQVALVEEGPLGGTCLNVGCIPTKVLLEAAHLCDDLIHGDRLGVVARDVAIDLEQVKARRNAIVAQLTGGVKTLLRKADVTVIQGRGRLDSNGAVVVTREGVPEPQRGRTTIIATGSRPAPLPSGLAVPGLWDSTRALALDFIPARLAIIGAGAVGVEFAEIYHALGCEVDLVEMAPAILPREDQEIASILASSLAQRGIHVHTGTAVLRVDTSGDRDFRVHLSNGVVRAVEAVLVAVGRLPNTVGIGVDRVCDARGFITVNDAMATSAPGIYAVGDVNGRQLLAHAASAQGVTAVERALGHGTGPNLNLVPNCIFTHPEVASVGLSETAARAAGYDVSVGRFPFAANGRALIMGCPNGLAKVVAERSLGRVLGVHIVGPEASALIHEGALAIQLEATLEEIGSLIHAHPTTSEGLFEAALAAGPGALHVPTLTKAPPNVTVKS